VGEQREAAMFVAAGYRGEPRVDQGYDTGAFATLQAPDFSCPHKAFPQPATVAEELRLCLGLRHPEPPI
jgi:hypothetical protein